MDSIATKTKKKDNLKIKNSRTMKQRMVSIEHTLLACMDLIAKKKAKKNGTMKQRMVSIEQTSSAWMR